MDCTGSRDLARKGQETALRRDRVRTVSLVITGQSVQALAFGGIALFLPLIRSDLHMSFAQAGSLSAAATFTYALMQIPAGYLADRFGSRRLFFFGLLGSMASTFLFGVLQTYGQALANQAVFGVVRAFVFAPGIRLVAAWFPPERRATAMGLYVAGGVPANIVLSLIGPLLVSRFGWRFAFLLFSAAGLVAAGAYLRFGRENPNTPSQQPVGLLDLFGLFRYRIMWVCGVLQFIRLGVFVGMAFWLPSLLIEDRGLSLPAAGLVIAMSAAFTAPANTLGGYISDRLRNPPLVIGASLVVLAITSTLLVTVPTLPLLLVVVAVASIFVQLYFGALFAIPIEVLGPRTAGMSIGFSNFFANVGSLAFAYGLGVAKDARGSFTLGFLGIAAACVVGTVFAVILAHMRNRALSAR